MRPVILITRPEQQTGGTQAFFEAHGYEVCSFPVLEIASLATPEQILKAFQDQSYDGITATSQQALSGLENQYSLHNIALYVPGEATAETAREIGFSNVVVAGGTAESLALLLPYGKYLYLRAENISVDLKQLAKASITELVTYGAYPNPDVAGIKALMQKERVSAVLFYSARTAACFEQMMAEDLEQITPVSAVTISEKVAAVLTGPWKRIVQSATPDEAGMLKALESLSLSRKLA